MDSARDNSGRGGGSGRGRGGDGRGYHQNQGGRGRGGDGRGYHQGQGGRGRGGEGRGHDGGVRGRGGDGRGTYKNQGGRGRGNNPGQPNQGGGRGWVAPPPPGGSHQQPPAQQPLANRPPVQVNQPPPQQAWGNRPLAPQQPGPSTAGPSTAKPGAWTGRPWVPSTPPTSVQPQPPPQAPHQPSADVIDIRPLKISEEKPQDNQIEVIRRPDKGGTMAIRSVKLLVNHFPVRFNPQSTILHYDVDVKPSNENGAKKKLRKSEMSLIKDKLFSENDRLKACALLKTVYDSEKNIFSAVPLPTGTFPVEIEEGEDVKRGSYTFTIKLVNELKLSKLRDYLSGNCLSIPRDILQGMDLVMKDNPSRRRIGVGRSFYSNQYWNNDDLGSGVAAYRGFQQSLKPTSRGLTLCLDYSVIAFRKPWPVLEFLKEHIGGFKGANDVKRFGREVYNALKGLKVTVTHRRTKQKYIVGGLSNEDASDVYFDQIDPEGVNPPRRTSLVDYFREKWGKNIMYPNIPCLELGRSASKSNKVPMEFCVLVEGQRFPKENLDRNAGMFLKDLSLAKPWDRRSNINEMVGADDGPCGAVSRNFEIEVDMNMMRVTSRVLGAPQLKLGAQSSVKMDAEKCQWNLLGKSFVDAKPIDRWALIDFTNGDRYNSLQVEAFVNNLIGRCRNLRIKMEEPLVYRATRMQDFASTNRLENLLKSVVDESGKRNKEKLQLIVCVMTKRDPGYKSLKWISETKIGVITQCCLSNPANKGQDQYLANLCLKINAKLGGSNFELNSPLPHFGPGDHVMFIGADVNHPAARNTECPSIAAVVGTVNWPAANRYAARVSPQAHRCEKIINFGSMCLDLINTYARQNRVRPARIVLFRDGVSEGQFEMVLSQEVIDFKKTVCVDGYNPRITVIVAQKRHQTRLFVENKNDGGRTGNVPPGTVVDTDIVHPHNFDFYLCSHYGGLGTSKPTHYYVLWDENRFSSDELQKLIYDMCFTYARCTKPVSLVPPVYYADLVAYRGRMFQEVLLETQYASSSSSGADASFNQSFYNLHSNLKDIMFFV
ncbi:protein argonaute 2 [Phtheirospermum japonicum]|uniref:Protein argonaute 2 n=1 Tax=Phtheirospermum japonicum TaxID=374723 RepID=A0A830D1T4_9LAMI|nr:protein argonaute 2 [Phtheirospermum japonicum]